MIVWGWGGGKPKHQGVVAPTTCPTCERVRWFEYVTSKKHFSLYFIPLVPYDSKHFLVCTICSTGINLTKDQRSIVEKMLPIAASWNADAITDEQYGEEVGRFWGAMFPPETPELKHVEQPAALSAGL